MLERVRYLGHFQSFLNYLFLFSKQTKSGTIGSSCLRQMFVPFSSIPGKNVRKYEKDLISRTLLSASLLKDRQANATNMEFQIVFLKSRLEFFFLKIDCGCKADRPLNKQHSAKPQNLYEFTFMHVRKHKKPKTYANRNGKLLEEFIH